MKRFKIVYQNTLVKKRAALLWLHFENNFKSVKASLGASKMKIKKLIQLYKFLDTPQETEKLETWF